MLIVLAVAKLFATSLLLATGWKGGYIFPIMFASVALGLAVNLVFPAYSDCGHRRGDDGGRARRGDEGAAVRGALYDGPGAEGDRAGDCRRRGCRAPCWPRCWPCAPLAAPPSEPPAPAQAQPVPAEGTE